MNQSSLAMLGSLGGSFALVGIAPLLLLLGYFFIRWDCRQADSPNRDDAQVGLKLVLFGLMVVALGVASGGGETLLHYLLSGAKTGTPNLKAGIAGLVAGGLFVFAVLFMFLPRTNNAAYPQASRFTAGTIALLAGATAIVQFSAFADGLIGGRPWADTSGSFAGFVAYGAIAFLALNRLGTMSGWSAAVRPMPPPSAGYPPGQQGGYPPQGG